MSYYWHHERIAINVVSVLSKNVLIIAGSRCLCLCVVDRRVMFIGRGEVFGQWNCNWDYTWAQLKEAPLLTPKGIQILLKVRQVLTWTLGQCRYC